MSSNDRPFCSATGRNVCWMVSQSPRASSAVAWTSIFPASTLDRSRMSLISSSRSEPARWIVRANSICLSVRLSSGLSDSSLARISRLLSGVRSSWLMLARNSFL